MPRTVAEGFSDFLAYPTPSKAESVAAISHRASIEACLKNNLVVNRLFRTGSFGNGTSISGYSDVDYFVSLGTDDISASPTYTLTRLRNALDALSEHRSTSQLSGRPRAVRDPQKREHRDRSC